MKKLSNTEAELKKKKKKELLIEKSVQLFLRNFRLNFLVTIDWFLFAFADFLWCAGNWILSAQFLKIKTVSMKDFPLIILD